MASYWVYILHCSNDTYYTGYTTDLTRRYEAHISGRAKCKYTRSFKPIRIAQAWELDDKGAALRAERWIKQLSRKAKEELILNPDGLFQAMNDGISVD